MSVRQMPAWLLAIVLVVTLLAGCTAGQSLPQSAGQYGLQSGSVCADGNSYKVMWVDQNSAVHQGALSSPAVVRDERNYLEVAADSQYSLHLREDEGVTRCQDNAAYNRTGWSTWIPIPIPIGGSRYDGPTTNAPSSGGTTITRPSDSGRDPLAKPSQSSPPNAVGGFNSGTGSGSAATDKSSSGATGGLSGGTGSGSAATGKSGSSVAPKAPAAPAPKAPAPKIPSIGGGKIGGKR